MSIFTRLREARKQRAQARYERNKRKKIAVQAARHGVRTAPDHAFSTGTKEDDYLRAPKGQLRDGGLTMLGDHKLALGGYLIFDDWLLSGARQALLDFRAAAGITEPLYQDFSGVFWRKTAQPTGRRPGISGG